MDSFGQIYVPTNSPMPKVKLAAGFEPALYTMFDGQPCQNRYHNFDDKRDSYPLSAQHRVQFQSALNWLGGDAKSKGITWLNTGKGEAVFAYPSSLPEAPLPYVQFFGHPDRSETFKEISGSLLAAFNGIPPKDRPESVQVSACQRSPIAMKQWGFKHEKNKEQKKGCHLWMASFFRFIAANLSLTHTVTAVSPR